MTGEWLHFRTHSCNYGRAYLTSPNSGTTPSLLESHPHETRVRGGLQRAKEVDWRNTLPYVLIRTDSRRTKAQPMRKTIATGAIYVLIIIRTPCAHGPTVCIRTNPMRAISQRTIMAAATAMMTTAQIGRPSSGPRGAGKVPWILPSGGDGGTERESHKDR